LVLPVVLLHVASFLFSLHDRSMKPFASRVVTDSFGHTLRCYELKQPDAEWDIIFIHGTPATATVFGEQFRHPFPPANLVALARRGLGADRPQLGTASLEVRAAARHGLLKNKQPQRT